MKKKSLGRNALYNIIYKVLNVIFPLISTAYVSRTLLAEGVGRVSAVSNNVSYFLILSTLGIPAYGLREIAKSREDNEERSKIFSELFTLNLILTICTYILFNVIAFTNSYFKSEFVLYEIFGFTILLNVFNVDWLFQGLEEYGYIAIRSSIIKIISIIALFIFVKDKSDIFVYAIIQVVATTGNYILNVFKSRSYVKFSLRALDIKRRIKPLVNLALCSVSTELYAKMDITMLDVMKSSEVVGYYTSSQKIINLIITTLVAVTSVFMPRLSFLFDTDKREFNKILNTGFDLMVTISIPACIGLIVVSQPLVLSFLGNDFDKATFTVSILSFMIPLKCIGDLICYQVMMSARQESLLMKSYFITMIVNLINNFLLIPKFGAEGASVASVISEILVFIFVVWFSRKYFKLERAKIVLSKTMICTIAMVCVIIPLNFMQCSCFFKLASEGFVGVLIYFLVGLIIKHQTILQYVGFVKTKIKRTF